MRNNTPSLKAETNGDVLDLQMYGIIGNDWWGDGDTIDAKAVAKVLAQNKSVKQINLNLSSGGGDPFHAMAIYGELKSHPAKVVANIHGIAASAATFIVCAADEIIMNEAGLFMIHEAAWGTYGTVAEQQAILDATKKINEQAAALYAARTGKPVDEMRRDMAATTWMTASEAMAKGFVTSVSPLKAMAAELRPGQFLDVPEHIKPLLANLSKGRSEMSDKIQSTPPAATTTAAADGIAITTTASPAVQSVPTAASAQPVEVEPSAVPGSAPSMATSAEATKVIATTLAQAAIAPDQAANATNRAADIMAACMLAGKPEKAVEFVKDPNQTVSTVMATLQAAYVAERKPIADGATVEPTAKSKDPQVVFGAEYDAYPELYANMGMTREDYIKGAMLEAGQKKTVVSNPLWGAAK